MATLAISHNSVAEMKVKERRDGVDIYVGKYFKGSGGRSSWGVSNLPSKDEDRYSISTLQGAAQDGWVSLNCFSVFDGHAVSTLSFY
jgi:hypothetical protein